MKLRQKLAVVLASAMVLTSVPVVTMAASTSAVKTNVIVEKGDKLDSTTNQALKIEFDEITGSDVFYVTLTNAKWDMDAMTALADQDDNITITAADSKNKVIEVKVTGTPETSSPFYNKADETIKLPIRAEVTTTGDVTATVSANGSGASVEEKTVTIATTNDTVATVSVGTATSFNVEGKIANITFKEAYMNSMKGDQKYALVELNDSDYEFDFATMQESGVAVRTEGGYKVYTISAEYKYGFGNETSTTIEVYATSDKQGMYVKLPNNITANSIGQVVLDGLYVKATVKNPAEGNITVDVSGDVEEARDLVVAVNGSFSATVGVTDDKEAATITAGQSEEVSFTFKETVDGTFTNGRSFEIMLDNGYFVAVEEDANGKLKEDDALEALRDALAIKHRDTAYTADQISAAITGIEIEDDKVVGFTFKPATAQIADKIDSFTFTVDVNAGIEQEGEVKVSVDGRDLDEAVSAVVANIKTAVEVTSEAAVLKTGLLNQEAGKITIKESEAGILDRNEKVVVYLPEVKGISFSTSKDKLPEVTVTEGDIQVSDIKITEVDGKDALVMTIKRDSKTASTIEIANFHIDTDRTVAEGAYDVEIGGKAMTSHNETMTIADFIKVGTANTEDLVGANGLAKGTSTFVIGENKYTLNGVEKTMDAASYIQDPGYTMIPVRYVAEAFGVKGNDILFSKGVVTIFAGNRTVQLTNGSDIAVVNGAQIQMATKVVVKDGRTYAPVGEIARILGVSASWDNTAKTATFTNK